MTLPNAAHSLPPQDREIARVTRPHRVPHLPEGISQDVGALYQHALGIGLAAMRLAEGGLAGSAPIMQFAAEEVAELAPRAKMTAVRIERQLARHRRRNPL